MRLVVHVVRLGAETLRYSIAARRLTLLLVVVAGLVAVGLAAGAKVAVPLSLYPFA